MGIQWIFKHSLKWSYHKDVVADILTQLDHQLEKIIVNKKLGVVCYHYFDPKTTL